MSGNWKLSKKFSNCKKNKNNLQFFWLKLIHRVSLLRSCKNEKWIKDFYSCYFLYIYNYNGFVAYIYASVRFEHSGCRESLMTTYMTTYNIIIYTYIYLYTYMYIVFSIKPSAVLKLPKQYGCAKMIFVFFHSA